MNRDVTSMAKSTGRQQPNLWLNQHLPCHTNAAQLKAMLAVIIDHRPNPNPPVLRTAFLDAEFMSPLYLRC